MRALFNPKTLATLTAFGFSALVFPQDNLTRVDLGDLSDLSDNQMRRVQVGENKENYIVVLKKHGSVQAFSGKCCHFGAPLDTGYFDGKRIWCPWHLAKFCSWSGELVGGPGLNSLKKYKVEKSPNGTYTALVDQDSASASRISSRMVKPDFEADKRTFVVVGGGQAAQMGIEQLRKSGFQGKIVMISKEKQLPYDRIILTKSLRAEASKLSLRDEEFYQEYGIELKLNSEVVQICGQTKNVILANGEKVPFDKLLLATGSKPRILHKNAVENKNVFTIRTAEDHNSIKRQIKDAQNVVIVGGSFVGMEFAWAVKKDFKDKNVTVFELEERPLERIFGSEIAGQLVELQRRNGVEVLTSQAVKSFNSENGAVVSVTYTLDDQFRGPRDITVPADLVVLATGSQLENSYIPSCLTNPDGSVAVDSHMQTNHPDIYAAGDIASYPSLLTQSKERTEHWAVAGDQAVVAAKNMLDLGINYTSVPFFWTNQWVNAQFIGYNNGADWSHTVTCNEQGAEKTARITFFFKGHRVIGAAIINCPGAAIKLALALENGLMPNKQQICNGKVTYYDIVKRVEGAKQGCCH